MYVLEIVFKTDPCILAALYLKLKPNQTSFVHIDNDSIMNYELNGVDL